MLPQPLTAKIADFGLSLKLQPNQTHISNVSVASVTSPSQLTSVARALYKLSGQQRCQSTSARLA